MFLNEPALRPVRDKKGRLVGRLKLEEKLEWAEMREKKPQVIKDHVVVPAGFETDFASLPGFLRAFIDRLGKTSLPATLHDYEYSRLDDLKQGSKAFKLARKLADKRFLRAMKSEGVNLFRRNYMYRGVRAFGGIHYWVTSKGLMGVTK